MLFALENKVRAGWGLGVRVWREAKSKMWEVGGNPKGGRRAKMRECGKKEDKLVHFISTASFYI